MIWLTLKWLVIAYLSYTMIYALWPWLKWILVPGGAIGAYLVATGQIFT